jgi:hypothetical protein
LSIVSVFQELLLYKSEQTARTTAQAALKAAEAAQLHARASVASEIGEIKLVKIDLVHWPLKIGQPERVITPGLLFGSSLVSPIFINAGRTRCKVIEYCVEWKFIRRTEAGKNIDLIGAPKYTNISEGGIIFHPDQPLRVNWQFGKDFEVRLSQEEIKVIAANDAWLWVYGFVAYVDFMKEVHEFGFVAHWEAIAGATIPTASLEPRGFVVEGPPQFMFERVRKQDA